MSSSETSGTRPATAPRRVPRPRSSRGWTSTTAATTAPRRRSSRSTCPASTSRSINLEVRGRSLVITGERPVRETEGRTYQQVELPSGPFRRVVELQIDVRADEAQASYEDGILRVELPVRLPEAVRQVPIERATEEQ